MSLAIAGLSVLILAFLAHYLFWYNRVPNRGLSALLLVWSLQLYWFQPVEWYMDFASAGVAFALGLVAWKLKLITASETKLLFVAGLILGWQGGLIALVNLPFIIILMNLAMRLDKRVQQGHHPFWRRLRILASKKKLPHGIPVIFCTIIATVAKLAL
jgi:Flp pilus assembly protein protease CpaA